MKKLKIMKDIDSFLFKQVDTLMLTPEIQKVLDSYAGLEEKVQETIKIILMIFSILIPLLFIFIFYSINSSKKEDIKLKTNLIEVANTLIQKKSMIKSEEFKVLGSRYIDSQRGLKTQIDSTLNLINVDTSKVQISDFSGEDLDGLITKVSANLAFKGLTAEGLMALFNSLNAKLKSKLDEVSIKKNEITNSLDGVITLHYYSKEVADEGDE